MSAADGMMIWTGDYLADTQHLSNAQHGSYLLLLMAMWRNGGSLPLDDAKLARIVRLPVNKWRQIAPAVMDLMTIDGDQFTQKRLSSNLKSTLERIEKRRLSGSAGGKAKSLNEKDRAVAIASDLLQQNPTDAPETKTWTVEEEKKKEVALRAPVDRSDWPTDAFEQFYQKFPHKVGKQAAIKAFAKARRATAPPPWQKLMHALEQYIANKPADRAWCNPATWLNEGRWDDEPAANGGVNGNGTGNNRADRFTGSRQGQDAVIAGVARYAARRFGHKPAAGGDVVQGGADHPGGTSAERIATGRDRGEHPQLELVVQPDAGK